MLLIAMYISSLHQELPVGGGLQQADSLQYRAR